MLPKDFELKPNMKVKLREDLINYQKYGSDAFVPRMKKGEEVIIKTNIGGRDDSFAINDDDTYYIYTSEMVDYVISSDVTKKYTMEDLDKIGNYIITNIPTHVWFKSKTDSGTWYYAKSNFGIGSSIWSAYVRCLTHVNY